MLYFNAIFGHFPVCTFPSCTTSGACTNLLQVFDGEQPDGSLACPEAARQPHSQAPHYFGGRAAVIALRIFQARISIASAKH